MKTKKTASKAKRGNCYVTCEALYHLLGGAVAGYVPHTVKHEGDVHWYLVREQHVTVELLLRVEGDTSEGRGEASLKSIIDPTASQFKTPPRYHLGRGRGFLTKQPSKRARALMEKLVWQ